DDACGHSPSQARRDMDMIIASVRLFRAMHLRLPETMAELTEGVDVWQSVPTDPWGAPYQYSLSAPTQVSGLEAYPCQTFYLWSLGEDGLPGGSHCAADIGSWIDDLAPRYPRDPKQPGCPDASR
ncbi:MAG: type II secretion system protein GspG, partial [Pseudomonadota bacterium]